MNTSGKFNQNEPDPIMKVKKSKKYIAIITAVVLWIISIVFNMDGFNFQIPERAWMGIALGIIVTVMQFVGNSTNMKEDKILFWMCMLAYGYSIYMDIIGIVSAMQIKVAWSSAMIMPVVLAAFIEITPEPLIIWAFKLKVKGGGLFDTFAKDKKFSVNKGKSKLITTTIPFRPVYHNPIDEKDKTLEIMRDELRRDNFEKRYGN